MTNRIGLAWALATVFLAATRAAEMRFNAGAVGGEIDLSSISVVLGITVAAAIHAAVIVWLAARSRLPDPARLLSLVGVGLGFVIVNNLEAVVFRIAPPWPLVRLAAMGAVVHAIAAVGIARLVPARVDEAALSRGPLAGRTPGGFVMRVALLGLLYAVIYFVAGATIYPFVREFYANKPLPSTGPLFALQVLVRGPLFVGIGALVITLLRSSRATHAAAVACTLAGIGGVTALLAPNPLFPDDVRLVHLAEVGISNAVFGWIVGWVLTSARDTRASVASPVVPPSR